MASLESGEIAGIAVTLSAIALVLLVLLLVFLVRHRQCSSMLLLFSQNSSMSRNHQKTRQTVNGHLQLQPGVNITQITFKLHLIFFIKKNKKYIAKVNRYP